MKKTKKSNWITVLLIPVIAFAISAWTVYKFLDERGYTIRVEFKSADGIEVHKTLVKYHGVPVGKVEGIELSDDLMKVVLVIRLEKKASRIASKGAKFKIVKPKASIGELENIEAILSGNYIEVELPGAVEDNDNKIFYYYFVGEEDATDYDTTQNDLWIKLKASDAFSATKVGSKIFYKGFPVGVIEDLELPSHGQYINFKARVFKKYAHFVRANSVFWDIPVLDLDWKITKGFKIKTLASPIQTAINGGVGFATPTEPGSYVGKNHSFKLEEDFMEEWTKWQPVKL